MGVFRRLCLLVFGLAGLVCLAALVLPALGLYQREINTILADPIFANILLGCAAVAALGLLFCMLKAIFTPRNYRSVIVSSANGDTIQVTRDAIKAQAAHIVERDGTLTARHVNVRAKKRGKVRVFVRVRPNVTINVVERGAELHDELMEGLAEICGNTVTHVGIEFVDAASHEEPATFEDLEATYSAESPDAVHEGSDQAEDSSRRTAQSDDITVRMSQVTTSRQEASVAADAASAEGESAAATPAVAGELDAAGDEVTPDEEGE